MHAIKFMNLASVISPGTHTRALGKMSNKYLNTSNPLMNILHCRICEY